MNTLQNLKVSLDHDSSSQVQLLSVLEKHHDYLDESLSVLVDPNAYPDDKQLHLARFVHVINMHGRAEEETLYAELMNSQVREARFQAHVSQDEQSLAFQLADEIKEMEKQQNWSDAVDAKTKVMASLVRTHWREEQRVLFPLAKKCLDADTLNQLTQSYLDKCNQYLEMEIGLQELEEHGQTSSDHFVKVMPRELSSIRH